MTAETAFGMLEIFHAGAWGSFCDGDIFRYEGEYLTIPPQPYTLVRIFLLLESHLLL